MVIPFCKRTEGDEGALSDLDWAWVAPLIPARAMPPSRCLLEKVCDGFMGKIKQTSPLSCNGELHGFDACPDGGNAGILPLMSHEETLVVKGITLPPAPQAAGLYKPMMVVGNLAYLSGHLPLLDDGTMMVGQVGSDQSVDQGNDAARQVGLNMLATLRAGLGSLDKIVRVVKLLGLVNSPSGFTQHPQVINGCSELLKEVFGDDHGVGARSAFGVPGLPAGAMVEIEGIFEIQE